MALQISPDSFSRHVIPGAANLLSSFAEVAAADRAARAARQREERQRRYKLADDDTEKEFQHNERVAREQAEKDRLAAQYTNNLSLQDRAAEKVRLMNTQSVIDAHSLGLINLAPADPADPEVGEQSYTPGGGLNYMDILKGREAQGMMDWRAAQAEKDRAEAAKAEAYTKFLLENKRPPGSKDPSATTPKVGYSADAARLRQDAEDEALKVALQFPQAGGFAVDDKGKVVLDANGKPQIIDPAAHADFIAKNRDTRLREQGLDAVTMQPIPPPDETWHAVPPPEEQYQSAFGHPQPTEPPPNSLMDNWRAPAGYVPQAQKRTMAQIQASVQRMNAAGNPITLEQAIAKAQAAGIQIADLPTPDPGVVAGPMADVYQYGP